MKIPKLQAVPCTRQMVEVFGGYNHNRRIGEGEFYEMENMCSDGYPALLSRPPRGLSCETQDKILALAPAGSGYCYITAGKEGGQDTLHLPGGHTLALDRVTGERSMVTMGAYLLILPDKRWVNLAKLSAEELVIPEDAWGKIASEFTSRNIRCVPCDVEGTEFTMHLEKPEQVEQTDRWIDHDGQRRVLKKKDDLGHWVTQPDPVTKLKATGIGRDFYPGDTVQITNLSYRNQVYDGKYQVLATQTDSIVVDLHTWDPFAYADQEITVSRKMPDMDFVVEVSNRLWGCKYGQTEHGFVNELYASKQGDFRNWESFQGISTDSYVTSVGAEGPFTGAVAYQGRPVFFKEDTMMEIYGSYPANYQLQTTPCNGVQEGCHKSLVTVNNALYYKARDGICVFDGALPVRLGRELGEIPYRQAVAGTCGGKYYISMCDEYDTWALFVYDTDRRLWHREDALQVRNFCTNRGILYCLPAHGRAIYTMNRPSDPEETVSWMAETGQLGLSLPDHKYVSDLRLRLRLATDGQASIYARYDSVGPWEHLHTISGTALRSITVPIRPKRCDHVQLQLRGRGGVTVYSLTKTVSEGGYDL